MSPLWVLPLIVVAIGLAFVARAARATAAAVAELSERSTPMSELRLEAEALRADVDALAERARGLSWRPAPAEGDASRQG